MKTLEDMIKDKIEEVLVLMQANGDSANYGGTSYTLENGNEVTVSQWESSNSWYSSSSDC